MVRGRKNPRHFGLSLRLRQAREQSGLDLRAVGNTPRDLAEAMGLIDPRPATRALTSRWLMEEVEY